MYETMSVKQEIANKKAILKDEIDSLKNNEKFKLYAEKDDTIDCVNMLLETHSDGRLDNYTSKELGRINLLFGEAIDILTELRKGA